MKSLEKSWRDLSFFLTPRYLAGLVLIIASFISAFIISSASDRTVTVWASTGELAPGEIITEEDITPMRVRLIENGEQYLSASSEIVGASILRSIGASEFIPSFAIAEEFNQELQQVPISVAQDMVPAGLKSGAVVDIYGVPEPNQTVSKKDSTKLILSGVSVDAVTANEFGGRIQITALVPYPLLSELIAAIGKYQFLIVKRLVQ